MTKKWILPLVIALIAALALAGSMVSQAFAAGAPPQNAAPSEGRILRAAGVVVSVDVDANTLVLKLPRWREVTLSVTEQTQFEGLAAGLAEIEPGMRAAVAGKRQNGQFVLRRIVTRPPLQRYLGQVTAVDLAAGALTLETRAGESITVQTDENTRYRSRDGSVEALDDITVGMWARAAAIETEDGLLAKAIGAAARK